MLHIHLGVRGEFQLHFLAESQDSEGFRRRWSDASGGEQGHSDLGKGSDIASRLGIDGFYVYGYFEVSVINTELVWPGENKLYFLGVYQNNVITPFQG